MAPIRHQGDKRVSVRHQGDKRIPVDNWESHVDRMIRDAQARGEFENLPGTGKPLDLDDNPFAGEWQSAYRLAKNAGAAPLWVQLDKEITTDLAELQAMAERTARYLQGQAARLRRRGQDETSPAAGTPGGQGEPARGIIGRWWPFGPRRGAVIDGQGETRARGATPAGRGGPGMADEASGCPTGAQTVAELKAERRRARGLYLVKADAVDNKIKDFNNHRPPNLTWLEKPRLLPQMAAQRFDAACPPLSPEVGGVDAV